MLYSVTDIGSNTVKCAVFELIGNRLSQVDFFTKQLGLIAKIENNELNKAATDELICTINEYKSMVDSKHFCFATESLRRINNLFEVLTRIKEECSVDVELISGNDEALLSFEGFITDTPHVTDGIMVDMGGGSTEILRFENRRPVKLNSFKFGCLSLRREFVSDRFPTEDEVKTIEDRTISLLSEHQWIKGAKRICLIGGTGSSIGKLAIELGFTKLPEFTKDTFSRLFEYLYHIDDRKIEILEKHIPSRVETILPGMIAYKKIISEVNADKVYISSSGIREGFIYRKLRG